MTIPILSILIFLPIIGGLCYLVIPADKRLFFKWGTTLLAGVEFILSVYLFIMFDDHTVQMQFIEKHAWIIGWGVDYHVGTDGISMLLIVLTTFITLIAIPASFSAIDKHVKEFHIALLTLLGGIVGVFASLDLFLFYVFWEVMLIPMYLIIGIWGGENRVYASIKFFIYTMAGSVLMLIGILVLYFYHASLTGVYTFNLLDIYATPVKGEMQLWLFCSFFIAFAIKVPMFPLHTWLPDAHVEAPTIGSVILAAVLLKMGTYGMLRFGIPLFPESVLFFTKPILWLSVIGIIYGALVAMVQTDIKKLVAYSSISHLGYCTLGIFALTQKGIEGSILQMINHGLSTGALFLLIGILYERRHTREIVRYGGIAKRVPIFTVVFMITTFSSIGLPGLNGFIGEFLILLGTFEAYPLFAIIASSGVILSAVYMLWMVQRVFFGKLTEENQTLTDMNKREFVYMIPILTFIFWIGIYPETFLSKMRVSVEYTIQNYNCSIHPTSDSCRTLFNKVQP